MIRLLLAVVWFFLVVLVAKWLGVEKGDDVAAVVTGLVAVFGITALFPGYFYRGEPFRPKR